MSGRVYFTEEIKCAEISGATASQSDDDESDIICGEMGFDTGLANLDTKIKHECGQWRPTIVLPPGQETYDYSWHHVMAGYYGPYLNPGTSGLEDTPTDPGGTPGGEPTPTPGGGNPDGTPRPILEDVETPSLGPGNATQQTQHGVALPESPGNIQRFNVFGRKSYNVLGSAIFNKPQGFSVVKVTTYIKVSDPIPAGESIEMNLKLGEWKDDLGPSFIASAAIKLDSSVIAPPNMIRVERRFTGYQKDRARMVTLLFERRNDLPTPDVEVWVVKHVYTFES